jgi:hypothetical protein
MDGGSHSMRAPERGRVCEGSLSARAVKLRLIGLDSGDGQLHHAAHHEH